jgi:hypothetical protein
MTTTAMPHSSHLLVHRRLRYSSNGPFHRNGRFAPKPAVARNWSFGHAALLHDYCTAQATAVALRRSRLCFEPIKLGRESR